MAIRILPGRSQPTSLGTSLLLLKIEVVITAGMMAMPVMNEFFASIGMSQAQIGWSQAIFTVVLFGLNIPAGWVADKYLSRRATNALGDLIVGCSIVSYGLLAQNFVHAVIIEIFFGIGLALTGGVDVALLGAYCEKLKEEFAKHRAWTTTRRPIMEMTGAVAVGGFVGAYDARLAITLSSVPYFAGAVISCFLRNEQGELPPQLTLFGVVRESLHTDKTLKWHIAAKALGQEITHALVWIFTPLLLLAGVPVWLVGIGWAVNQGMSSVGSELARRIMHRFTWWERFAVGMAMVLCAILVLSFHVSLWSIWLLGVFGLVRGWFAVTSETALVHYSESARRTTVNSIAGSTAQVLYVPVVVIVNTAGTANVQAALGMTLAIFLPLTLVCGWKLRALERT